MWLKLLNASGKLDIKSHLGLQSSHRIMIGLLSPEFLHIFQKACISNKENK